jgi:phosphoglycolate phosphatase-like HAD superfamily hydrolase
MPKSKLRNIIWDFDGVILKSQDVRDYGFMEVFKNYPPNRVQQLMDYHHQNGGLSRYVKIRYFYEDVMNEEISDEDVLLLANKFSQIMKKQLTNDKLLIDDAISYIRANYLKFNFHIASGSDGRELQYLCEKLGINKYFKSIHGSPVPKKTLVNDILTSNKYYKKATCLIGDSQNDKDAALSNGIIFYGYNNLDLKSECKYIDSFATFTKKIQA